MFESIGAPIACGNVFIDDTSSNWRCERDVEKCGKGRM